MTETKEKTKKFKDSFEKWMFIIAVNDFELSNIHKITRKAPNLVVFEMLHSDEVYYTIDTGYSIASDYTLDDAQNEMSKCPNFEEEELLPKFRLIEIENNPDE
jgi:hypothetical protein